MTPDEWQAEQFEHHRAHLVDVARRMLGSTSEAEDAVQEAWLRVDRAGTEEVRNLRGWLTTVVSRICLDMLRARQARREDLGFEPPLRVELSPGPEQEALIADSVGLALLVVLESLTPVERLAFVLHDMFGVAFEEIAPVVERSVPATRQLASRARRRVRAGGERPPEDRAGQQRVVEAFLAASRDGDFDGLLRVLDPDVVFRGDGGAAGPPVPATLRGADQVARLVLARGTPSAPLGRPAIVNGRPGAIVVRGGELIAAVAFTIAGDRVTEMELVVDPVKLRAVAL